MDAGVGGRERGSAHAGAEAEWIHVTVPRHSPAHASRAVPMPVPVVSVSAGLAGRPRQAHPFAPKRQARPFAPKRQAHPFAPKPKPPALP
eukprot:932366-Rhodomonas_salina.1